MVTPSPLSDDCGGAEKDRICSKNICAGIRKLVKEKGSSSMPETAKIISKNMKVARKIEIAPKNGKFDDVLKAVGDAVASERKLRHGKVEYVERATDYGFRDDAPISASTVRGIAADIAETKNLAKENNLWVDVESGRDGPLVYSKTESVSKDSVTATSGLHHFRINGYKSDSGHLLEHIDSLRDPSNVKKVGEAIGDKKAALAYELLDTLHKTFEQYFDQEKDARPQNNCADILGLKEHRTYLDISRIAIDDYVGKKLEVERSLRAKIPFFGKKYVTGEIEKLKRRYEDINSKIEKLEDLFLGDEPLNKSVRKFDATMFYLAEIEKHAEHIISVLKSSQ